MSSICFSPNSSFPHLLFSFSFSFYRHAISFSFGGRGFMAFRTENASACRCPYSSFSGKTPPSHLRGLISKLQAHLGYNAPWGVLSGPPHVLRLLYLFGGYTMHYAIPCVSRKLLSRFSHAFCTYPRCFTLRDDCTDKTCATYTRVLPI